MRTSLEARRRGDDGFTLIELLIVIVILGVLAAIVVFSVRGIVDRGDKAACQANYESALTAAEAYYAKNGSDAASWGALAPTFLHSDPSNTGKANIDVGGTPAAPTKGSSC
jgi:prepilin-type N-terminal cleavage/methylation domain-containing protein